MTTTESCLAKTQAGARCQLGVVDPAAGLCTQHLNIANEAGSLALWNGNTLRVTNEPPEPTIVKGTPPNDIAQYEDLNKLAGDASEAQVQLRYTANALEARTIKDRTEWGWKHANPMSCFVAAVGNHWRGTSWAHVADMVQHANTQGFRVDMEELQDRCNDPYDALGTMRNEAIMKARQGYEYLLYVDTDVLPPADTLVRLMRHDRPIVSPYFEEADTDKPLNGPGIHRYMDPPVQRSRWSVLSMVLIKTNVFNAFGGGATSFWSDAVGADEGIHAQRFYDVGHPWYIDTHIVVPCVNKPTYPLASNRMTPEQKERFWQMKRDWLAAPPYRGPHHANDKRVDDMGVYMPFFPNNPDAPDIVVPSNAAPPLPPEVMPNGDERSTGEEATDVPTA